LGVATTQLAIIVKGRGTGQKIGLKVDTVKLVLRESARGFRK
jgi:hypothetical protein